MIKKYKKQLIISSVIILLPILIGLMMWNILPESMATHWNINGEADRWSSKAMAIFVLPVILLFVHWVCVFFTAKDPGNKEQNRKVFGMVLWIMPIISLLTSGMVYAIALGNVASIDIGVRVLLGLMFVVIGNYMPKCKQNHTIGIRVVWALRNEENWNKTHRFSGKVWVFGGILLLATIFIPLENIMFAFIAGIFILAFVPMIYSYIYYKKQLKAGTVNKEEIKLTSGEQKTTKISFLIGIGVLVLVSLILFVGKFEVQFEEEYFKVEASFWDDATVKYADIDEIEYRTEDKPGSRTFGYGSFTLLMGEFENSEFGNYTRYSYTSCDDCIVLTVDEKILVINGKDEAQTKEIFEELTKRIQ